MAMDQNNLWTGFQMPRRLAADSETLTERYGRFSAQPFERGFGTTVGNSLRRALLSSIEGAAVTAVKIEGVEHEFSSIKGVVEDATDVILNLKQVPFKLHGGESKTLRISKESAGIRVPLVPPAIALRRARAATQADPPPCRYSPPSRTVVRVDLHVIVGKVAGPHGGGFVAAV